MSGPPPKRSSQRRRQNKVDVDTAVSDGELRGPELPGQHGAVAKRWYAALRRSGQAQFFEPSDWAAAELVTIAIDAFVKRPSAMLLASITSAQTALLVTEADRRRLHLELERTAVKDGDDGDVAWIDDARRRLRDSAG